MATPRAVRVAVALSIATTGGAMYYYLSDGGDPEKLDTVLSETGAKLAETGAKLAETGTKLRDTVNTSVATWTQPTQQSPGASVERTGNDCETADQQQAASGAGQEGQIALRQSENEKSRGAYCHTCSGPRIWFFAEKLRLKRRFNPYPDPPRE